MQKVESPAADGQNSRKSDPAEDSPAKPGKLPANDSTETNGVQSAPEEGLSAAGPAGLDAEVRQAIRDSLRNLDAYFPNASAEERALLRKSYLDQLERNLQPGETEASETVEELEENPKLGGKEEKQPESAKLEEARNGTSGKEQTSGAKELPQPEIAQK